MEFELAQLNLARFRLPMEHPVNAPFVDNLDRVNAIAQAQPGFVYRNEAHLEIMWRRKEWLEKMQFYLVLWWVKKGQVPSVAEAQDKLTWLTDHGPSETAFDFSHPYPVPPLP